MPLLNVIVTLVIVGVVLYLLNMIEMDATIKRIIHALVILVVILWLLSFFVPMGHWNFPAHR